MTDMLQEFCDSRGASMRVDAQAGVIRGVKVLGLESRNGRTYLPEALAEAAPLYEDAKVNVNHPKGNPAGPRDYQDRIGTIRSVAMRPGEGLFADFHFNPKHALAEQLIWDAEHAPENVGFSHNVEARTSRRGERVVVEAITRVQSVDLVADPATTRGLFESAARSGRRAAGVCACCQQSGQCPQAAESGRLEAGLSRVGRGDPPGAGGRNGPASEGGGAADGAGGGSCRSATSARRLLREFDLPDPETGDPWAKTISGGQFLELLLGGAGRAGDAGDGRGAGATGAEACPAAQAANGWPTRGRNRATSISSTAPARGRKSFVEAIT